MRRFLLRSAAGVPEEELIRRAAERGVRVYGLSRYFLEPEKSCTVILGYANLSEEKIAEGAARLKQAWLA